MAVTTNRVCPGDGLRGCLVNIAAWQDRCTYCTRTVALRELAKARAA